MSPPWPTRDHVELRAQGRELALRVDDDLGDEGEGLLDHAADEVALASPAARLQEEVRGENAVEVGAEGLAGDRADVDESAHEGTSSARTRRILYQRPRWKSRRLKPASFSCRRESLSSAFLTFCL